MKKKPKERDWYIEAGFELRKEIGYRSIWSIYEGGQWKEGGYTLQEAKRRAQELRKSRNEASKANP